MHTTSSQVTESIGFTSSSLTKALKYQEIAPRAINFENFDEIARAQKIAEILMQALAGAAIDKFENATSTVFANQLQTEVRSAAELVAKSLK